MASSIRDEFERFFHSNSMVATYKPMFLKALLDLGDFREDEGSQWVKNDGDNLVVDLEFVAARFIYYCHPLYYKFKLKQQFGIMKVISYKIFEEFDVFKPKNKVSKKEFCKEKYKDARVRLVRDGISKTVFKLLKKDCDIYEPIKKSKTFTFSKDNALYVKQHKNQLTKALNHELSLFLGKFNNSPNIPSKLQEEQNRPPLDPKYAPENIKIQNSQCFYCEKPEKKFDQDHFIPWNYIYLSEKHNMVPACGTCNRSKHDSLSSKEFLEKIIVRNRKLKLSAGYSESSMRSEWENCRLGYHGENKKLWTPKNTTK